MEQSPNERLPSAGLHGLPESGADGAGVLAHSPSICRPISAMAFW
jgi:hypothetical protein